jgi:pre-rRNA-processing protein IPI1
MGLKELITMHPEVGRQHLSSIIERVSALFVDKDGIIRRTVLKFFSVLFPITSANALAPFFSVINAHLCCAMTHIDEQIQADSLSVVDALLKFYPRDLIEHCSQLLPNFINLISRQTQKNTTSGTVGTRTLSVNPNSKVHAQKWRMKVLERLYNFLVALAESVETKIGSNGSPDKSVTINCVGQNVFYQPKAPLNHQIPFCNGFHLRLQQGMKNLPHQDILNNPGQLKNFVTTLMPLLLDCWVECSPAQLIANIPGNAPPADTMAMMLSIIKVVQLLWQCVEGLASDNEEITVSS